MHFLDDTCTYLMLVLFQAIIAVHVVFRYKSYFTLSECLFLIWKIWRYHAQDIQYNGQKENDDLQTTTQTTKDRTTRTPIKTGDKLRCSGWIINSCSTTDTRGFFLDFFFGRITVKRNEHYLVRILCWTSEYVTKYQ